MKIYIIGTGYVGLVASACLAEMGHKVCGVDVDKKKIAMLKKGKSPIYEPGLEEVLKKNLKNKRLVFKEGIDKSINNYDLAVIAVGTPERKSDGRADLSYVEKTIREMAKNISKKEFVVINKSTVPVGTVKQIQKLFELQNGNKTMFHVGSNPEILREGNAIYDFMNPDRVIIGGDAVAQEALKKVYEKLDCPKVETNTDSAEMIKLASNFMLALRISTANIFSRLCDLTGADIKEVMRGVGLDKRIGAKFLEAGAGYGGSCFPKDIKNVRSLAESCLIDTSLFDSVIKINDDQVHWLIKKIEDMSMLSLNGTKVAVWGLAFKPETDDTREAPAIKIINRLLEEMASVSVYDPIASVEKDFGRAVAHCKDMYNAVKGAELLIIVTEWDQFKKADYKKVKSLMSIPRILDGRNILNPNEIRAMGFEYIGLGRK